MQDDTTSSPRLAQAFCDLNVYKRSLTFAMDVFSLSRGFPREEMFSLTDQIRRSTRAIGAAIAEAWAKRRYVAHFISKLTDADAEQFETQHWILVAFNCSYIDAATRDRLLATCQSIGRMLHAMIASADTFCHATPTHRHTDTPTHRHTDAPTHRRTDH
jgi:four helix bundle protein